MIEKRKKRILTILLSLLCLVLFCGCAAGGFLYFRLYDRYTQLEKTSMENQEANEKQKEELEKLQTAVTQYQTQLDKKNTQIERLKTRLNDSSAASQQTETLGPPAGGSVFSDGELNPRDLVDEAAALADLDSYFQSYEISRDGPVFQRINGKSYVDNEDIALEDLRYLRLLHYNFQNQVQVGEMIVNAAIAEDVLNIFKELFQQKYQIESIILVDEFWVEGEDGNRADFESIEVNNTSCFNYRPVSGGESLSNHAYGLAIDINPQQNPYVTAAGVYSHENAAPYLDRNSGDPAVIVQGDICYSIFEKYGFSWGGLWQDPIDYQHFEKPMA